MLLMTVVCSAAGAYMSVGENIFYSSNRNGIDSSCVGGRQRCTTCLDMAVAVTAGQQYQQLRLAIDCLTGVDGGCLVTCCLWWRACCCFIGSCAKARQVPY